MAEDGGAQGTAPTEVLDPSAPLPALPSTVLVPGTVLAGRWKILRMLGRGGMGAVYAARDLELEVDVALKVLRPELTRSEDALRRFRRELQLARAVTHRNVCRLFDLGQDATDGLVFLTMELIDGETLAQRLARGPIARDEVAKIAAELAAGLEAAHRAGVIHRDLKATNILLAKDRTVIGDFGVAYVQAAAIAEPADDAEPGATTIAGTPGYMAPEQAEGAAPSPAADVYALGAVLFELATGRLPDAPTTIAEVRALATRPAPSPRAAGAELDDRWEAAIRRCLAPRPADRYASAAEVAAALQPPLRSRGLVLGAVAIAALAIVATGVVILRDRGAEPSAPAAIAGPRPTIAVLPLRDDGAGAETARAVAELLAVDLSAGGRTRVVDAGDVTPDLRLDGTVSREGDALRVAVRVVDAGGRETRVERTGTAADLSELVLGLGEDTLAALGLAALTREERAATRAALPRDPGAARAYAQGVALLRSGEAARAHDLLAEAVRLEPDHALAQAELAHALFELGRDRDARAHAAIALEGAGTLARAQALEVEGRLRVATAEWDRAIEVYQVLAGFFPDEAEYGIALVETQLAAGRPLAAATTLDGLGAAARTPRGLLAVASARIDQGDHAGAMELAREAITAAHERGLYGVEARAGIELATGAISRGDLAAAGPALDAAEALFRAHDDRRGFALVLMRRTTLAVRGRDVDGAIASGEAALTLCRELGDRSCEGTALNTLGIVRRIAGDAIAAIDHASQALQVFRELDDDARCAEAALALGNAEQAAGRLDDAVTHWGEAAGYADRAGSGGVRATALGNLASVAFDRGDLAAAREAYAGARDAGTEAGDLETAAWADGELADLEWHAGDAAAARARMEAVLAAGLDPFATAAAAGRLTLAAAEDGDAAARTTLPAAIETGAEIDEELGLELAVRAAIVAADHDDGALARRAAARAAELAASVDSDDARAAAVVAAAAAARASRQKPPAGLAALVRKPADGVTVLTHLLAHREAALASRDAAALRAMAASAREQGFVRLADQSRP